ncbi:MAG: hypothetical protein RL217_921 [Pseudomonadota bacterium]|jgi:proline iminopeptidase
MRTYYPPIEPYETGFLEVGDGHRIYWERSGTKGAKPAVFLHGGPGGGLHKEYRQAFHPEHYDVLLFDQRGCGQSTPHAELHANTTWDLVADIERLRQLCGHEKWLVCGGSWGSTLALAYAQSYPDSVSELVLRGIFLTTQADIDWFYQYGVSEMHPDRWQGFLAPIPEAERGNLVQAYHKRLTGTDKTEQLACAKAWSQWEGATANLIARPESIDSFGEDHFAIAFARIENHFFVNHCWLEENQLLRDAHKLHGIQGVIVHGRYDMPCPLRNAWQLAQAWPDATLKIIEAAGHSMSEPAILSGMIEALDGFSEVVH